MAVFGAIVRVVLHRLLMLLLVLLVHDETDLEINYGLTSSCVDPGEKISTVVSYICPPPPPPSTDEDPLRPPPRPVSAPSRLFGLLYYIYIYGAAVLRHLYVILSASGLTRTGDSSSLPSAPCRWPRRLQEGL